VEVGAREMGLDPADLRRRNFVKSFPHQTPVIMTYDAGDYQASLRKAMEIADVKSFGKRKRESARNGKLRGIGYSTYIEACGIAPSAVAGALGARAGLYEAAEVRFHPTGTVTVFTGSHAHGQSHETTFAQVVSDKLGVPFENVEIVHGDTDRIPFGMGTYGSRSIAVGGVAIVNACEKVITKARKIAAHVLQTTPDNVEFEGGVFKDKSSNKTMTIGEVALTAYVPHNFPHDTLEPGLDEQAFYDPKNFTYPNGCYVCEVEVDQETGEVAIASFSAVDDFGNVINPMVVEGQVHGGLAQGIGQALLETCVYDKSSGQLISGSYMDYTMPRADNLPSFGVSTNGVACTHNVLGVKGCGEAGAIGAPAAVMNAVVDALAPLGVTHLEMPATAQNVWNALQSAKKKAAD
jgi:carbon-monoxide dehydrogenase large subunit